MHARILSLAETESYFEAGKIEVDKSYFGAKRVQSKSRRGVVREKTKVFRMKKRGNKVYRQIVNNYSAAELVLIIKKFVPNNSTIYSDEWKTYDDLMNAGYKKH